MKKQEKICPIFAYYVMGSKYPQESGAIYCDKNCAWYIEKQGCAVTVFVKSVSGMLKAGNLLKVMMGRPDLLKKLKKVVKKRETKRTS